MLSSVARLCARAAAPSARLFSLVARVPLTLDEKGAVTGQYPAVALEKLSSKLQVEGNEARNNRRAVRATHAISIRRRPS